MTPRPAAFAIPGDIDQKTGGYIYEKSLLLALNASGRRVAHVQLPGTFPDPSPAEMAKCVAALAALPAEEPLILDGLVYGAIDTGGLAKVRSPIVAMIHHPLALETGLPANRARFLHRREADNLALAAHVVVPSRHTREILIADYAVPRGRITIAPPGFPRPAPGRDPLDPPLILSVGLLAARKGHDILIDALSRITDLPWTAVIVGKTHDPAVAGALHIQASALGLDGRLRFAGLVADAELDRLYRGTTIFALATRFEGYGMVFGEAFTRGLPIVTCRAGAVPDTVPDTAGLLVPPDDGAAFAGALRRVLTDAILRDGLARGSAARGATLPQWADTAAIMGAVLDRVRGLQP